MSDNTPTVESLVAELGQMRASLAILHDTIGQQQAEIVALNERLACHDQESHADDAPRSAAETAQADDARSFTTSRRGLLRGAAAATAAAAVATVAVGGVQQAHAAPLADGGNMILGTTNSASSTTAISDSAGTASYLLEVSSYSTSTPSAAIHGQTTGGGAGVLGESYGGSGFPYVPGIGVQGASRGDTGVYGVDFAGGVGVEGASTTGVGLVGIGRGSGSWGVVGQSPDSVDLAAFGTGLIYQWLTTLTAPPSGAFSGGESIRLANGDLWICVAAGDPAPWAKVATLAPGATAGGAITYLSKPLRLLDTRPGQPAVNHPGSPYVAGSTHTITVSGASNGTVTVPAGCVGAIGNLTVIGLSGGGNYVELVPSGVGFQGTSNLNFAAGQLVANSYNVGLNASGALDIILGSGGNADVILDLYAIIA